MPRRRRIILPGIPYHITHRGNRREPVFDTDCDRKGYLHLLKRYADSLDVRVLAYCLMTNHVHLILVPSASDSLSRLISRTHGFYSRDRNQRRETDGHCWAARFFACPLDMQQLWKAVRYVELNPVRACIVARAESYRWSSARAHAWGELDDLLADDRPFPGSVENWAEWLAAGLSELELSRIRECTQKGWACGSPDFIHELEMLTGEPFSHRAAGPKPSGEASR